MSCASRTVLCLLLLAIGCGDGDPSLTTGESSSSGEPGETTGTPLVMTAAETSTGDDTTTGESTGEPPTSSTTTADEPEPMYGLRGEYWATYLDLKLERVDATVDFNWADQRPADGFGVDRFSIRWTGQIAAPASGTYTLITETDDGVRVWVDDVLVIDDWNGHFVTRNEAKVELKADAPAKLRIDYFEIDLEASATLKWSSDAIAEEVVPRERLIAAEAASGLAPPKPPFTNPVEAFDCPDPGVLAVEEDGAPIYYKVCTGGVFPIRKSRDLVLWSDTGVQVLPKGKPAWAANGSRNWAPELHRLGDKIIAYYTTVNGGDVLCIGAATADGPLGPYTESPGPLVEHPLGVIDSNFVEHEGKPYLLYKIDGNSQGMATPIFIRELGADGLSFVGEATEVLTNNINSWEGGVVEAPWVVARDGYFYMFYSGNVYDHRYRTGVARSDKLMGPYEKLGAPVLGNNNRWVGPGHGSVVTVAGVDYFVYHAWANNGEGKQDESKGRRDLVDRITWADDGWPKIADGSPSDVPQPWPGEP
jgi:GH43 family beta-xylosidase